MIVKVPAQQHAAAAHYIHAEIMMQIPAGNGMAAHHAHTAVPEALRRAL